MKTNLQIKKNHGINLLNMANDKKIPKIEQLRLKDQEEIDH